MPTPKTNAHVSAPMKSFSKAQGQATKVVGGGGSGTAPRPVGPKSNNAKMVAPSSGGMGKYKSPAAGKSSGSKTSSVPQFSNGARLSKY